ncbi:hypothetical protein SEPCBS57363_005144 [Sporothrix epigloea]|uniref:MINDY deubiquitinase domain-containing protein n=1 Tax=Sporothrix epigloea TaxID=1892477 RepID=A0ABP0DW97_9PEZI
MSPLDPRAAGTWPERRPTSPGSSTPSSSDSKAEEEEQSAWIQSALQDSAHEFHRSPLQQRAPAAPTHYPTNLLQSATSSSDARRLPETNPFRRMMASTSELPSPSFAGMSSFSLPPLTVAPPDAATTLNFSQLSMDDQTNDHLSQQSTRENGASHLDDEVPGTSETYQVKNISWYDFRAEHNPRTSPILLQNANGPCPLVALVNALSLSSPADGSTSLMEILKTKKQVSLSLILQALVDELTSCQRSTPDCDLPDIDELLKFLSGLHTGMNVNPRFIPTPDILAAFHRTSLTHLHPTERDNMIPGTFEDTREIQLYTSFKIPLIHGWLPTKGDGSYEALTRQAESYEDVQNLLFRENELLDKLSRPYGDGLSEEEQRMLQDIEMIKTYMEDSCTQLTPFGLEVIAKAMIPGSFAVLFRNNHFSTLYLHPQTLQLLSLMTDAGYASHDEVVWETLVDVNGEHTEIYSGDFRLVSGVGTQQSSSSHHGVTEPGGGGRFSPNNQDGWTPAHGSRLCSGRNAEDAQDLSQEEFSSYNQQDRDYAFALQLQNEEMANRRTDEAQQNNQLSERFIERDARTARRTTQSPVQSPAPDTRRSSIPAGDGRYGSSQAVPTTPRWSTSRTSNENIHADNYADHRRTLSSSNPVPAVVITNSNIQRVGRHYNPPSSTPRTTNFRPAVHRVADNEHSVERPPSYELAAGQSRFHTPIDAFEPDFVSMRTEDLRTTSPTRLPGRNSTSRAHPQSNRRHRIASTSTSCTMM